MIFHQTIQIFVEWPGCVVSTPVVVVSVRVGEEIPTQNWEIPGFVSRLCLIFVIQGCEVVGQGTKVGLKQMREYNTYKIYYINVLLPLC